jgi:TP901 family phage tail tape measure protein
LAKQLEAQIVLMGKIDQSFTQIGDRLTSLGNQIQSIGFAISLLSAPIIGYGKSVLDVYKDYDNAIREIQAVGNYTDQEMQLVIANAREYGAQTRYSSTDAAQAMITVTQAGYGLEEMFDAMPAVLRAAIIGGQDLHTTAEQIVKSMTAAGIKSGDAMEYIDSMAAVASASTTDVAGLTESMVFLGSIPRAFSGGYKEALKWLGVLGDLGYEGTTSGMHLRNMYLSLAAPTKGAAEALEEMAEATGESVADIQASLDEFNASGAVEEIKKLGLQIFDAKGNFRSFDDIFTDFNKATANWTQEDKAGAFKKIFARRTFAAADAAMQSMGEGATKLDEALENSNGQAQRMVDTMESGIGGAAYELESAWEEVQLAIGDILSEDAIGLMERLRSALLDIASADKETIRQWVDWAIAIAALGPGLTIAGKAMSVAGTVLKTLAIPGGKIAMGTAAVAALLYAIDNADKQLTEADIQAHMGDIEMNALAMQEAMTALDGGFGESATNLQSYSESLKSIAESYTSISTTLSGNLLEAVVFDVELSEADIKNLKDLGESLVTTVGEGIKQAKLGSAEFIKLIFGDSPEGDAAMTDMNTYYGGLEAEFAIVGQTLRDQIVEALRDKNLNEAEREAINASVGRLSEIQAQIMMDSQQAEMEKAFARAQRLGKDSFIESMDLIAEGRDKYNETMYDYQDTMVGMYEAMFRRGDLSRAEADLKQQSVRDAVSKRMAENAESYNLTMARLMTTVMGDAYEKEFEHAEARMAAGLEKFPELLMASQTKEGSVPYLTALEQWLSTRGLRGDYAGIVEDPAWLKHWQGGISSKTVEGMKTFMAEMEEAIPVRQLTDTLLQYQQAGKQAPAELEELYRTYFNARLMGALSAEGMRGLLDEDGLYLWEVITEKTKEGSTQAGQNSANAYGEAFDEATEFDTASIYAPLESEASSSGVTAAGNFSSSFNANLNLQLPALTVPGASGGGGGKFMLDKYAEGGRADAPSIFGEAGPEWAIPERHDDRTLALLQSAAKASGFTWADILNRTGGLNATPAQGRTFVFSPTIYANDAKGVDRALRDSEARMNAWWDEKKRDEERVVYG